MAKELKGGQKVFLEALLANGGDKKAAFLAAYPQRAGTNFAPDLSKLIRHPLIAPHIADKVRLLSHRPVVDYTPEIADRILGLLSDGKSLTAICRMEGMPGRDAIVRWAVEDNPPGFKDRYENARRLGWHLHADEIIDIADDATADIKAGKYDREHINRARLRVDTRKWVLSRMLPKIYGDRIQTQQLGAEGQPIDPVQPVINLRIGGKAAPK